MSLRDTPSMAVTMSEMLEKDAKIIALETEVARLTATAQRYPTPDAYEAACEALSKKTVELEDLREELERERALHTIERGEYRRKNGVFGQDVMLRYDILRIAGSLAAAEAQYRWVVTGEVPQVEEVQ